MVSKNVPFGSEVSPLIRMAAAEPPMRRSNCAESSYCALIHPQKGLTINNEAGQRAEMAWSNGKSAIFGLKTAHLNGGFRLDVVSTRRTSSHEPIPRGKISDQEGFHWLNEGKLLIAFRSVILTNREPGRPESPHPAAAC